jgi:2-acylglycerol O-acyltransferase 2
MFDKVGKPIDVPKIEHPTDEDVNKFHQMYIDELQRLYETYKDVYHKNRIKEMTLVQ